jgi:membrane fusion protein
VKGLFRPEAVEGRAATLFGGIIVAQGRGSTWLAWASVLLAAGLAVLLTVGTLHRRARVPGYISPAAGLVRVHAPRAGTLSRLDVAEGETVNAGAVLLAIASPRDSASGIDVDQAQIDRLREEEGSLRVRLEAERSLSAERRKAAVREAGDLETLLAGLREERKDALMRADLLRQDAERLEALYRNGHAPAALRDSRVVDLLAAEQEVQRLGREMQRTGSELAAVRSTLHRIPLEFKVVSEELHSRLAAVRRNVAEAEAQQAIIVRAPVAGRVTALVAYPGMAVTPERPLLSIIPADSELQAELLLPTRAAGFVREGQVVHLRYDAFPYQKFGIYRGSVRSVSRTVLNPEDQAGPVRLPVPAYRVIVKLDSPAVMAYGEELPLQPGLTLEADVIRDRRRIIEWIFDPVIAAARGI